MKRIKITSMLVLTSLFLFLTSMKSAPEDNIVGQWLSEDKEFNWEFFKSSSTYSVKLISSKDALEADGKTFKKDLKNPDQKLRNRSLHGITFITDLKYEGNKYTGGKVYASFDGKFYNCYASVDGDKLTLRLYKGISVLGKTLKFNRIK